MKLSVLLGGAALAALALAGTARAQTGSGSSLPVSGGVSDAGTIPRLPASGVPGNPGADPAPNPAPRLNGAVPPAPASSRTPLYPNGVPQRDIDAGRTRAAEPRSGQAMPGAQPTKSIFKGRKRQEELRENVMPSAAEASRSRRPNDCRSTIQARCLGYARHDVLS